MLGLLLAAGCGESVRAVAPPTSQFYFPTGLSLAKLSNGKTALLVVSSNFDLNYDLNEGGTLIAVDPDASGDTRADPNAALAILGSARIGSMGGEVVVADAQSCPGWTPPSGVPPAQVLVPSRNQNALYRVTLDEDTGALACGEGCKVALDVAPDANQIALADPYGVTLACRVVDGVTQQSAFVSFLRASAYDGYLTEVALESPTTQTRISLGTSFTFSSTYDAVMGRLYVTSGFAAVGDAPIRWVDLYSDDAVSAVNLYDLVRGAETRGIALSNPRAGASRLAYVALRLYDADTASSTGARPTDDVAGALAVVELTEQPYGDPSARVTRVVPLDRGSTQVKVLPARAGKGDLVAVTSPDDDSMTLYDDDTGTVVRTFALSSTGTPELGKQPFGMAVEQRPNVACAGGSAPVAACDRIYVGSFDRGYVSVVELDPDHPGAARVVKRIGRER
ncbi:YncE family protein [Anaeromyxobacter paludicola]|uniref:Lipoprotein n=1 Tax=Anaeromyxobacter paludicola TaxID=2918171 RepID=A0ABN6N4E3_9BACT|nr:hypothetical protein [Anaeromyxobacter paludicola]BDG08044.1 hypothetical protein AMPC_11570 [Anaeromyxobacter paludicola]